MPPGLLRFVRASCTRVYETKLRKSTPAVDSVSSYKSVYYKAKIISGIMIPSEKTLYYVDKRRHWANLSITDRGSWQVKEWFGKVSHKNYIFWLDRSAQFVYLILAKN